MVNAKLKALLEKQQYGFTGEHSAVKICSWTKKSLTNQGVCYKEKFYGIRSHLCAQITPSIGFCQNKCIFCWRDMADSEGTGNVAKSDTVAKIDEPIDIINNSIIKQNFLLNGFGGNDKADKIKFAESHEPMHFAISLTGEPTLYPKLDELISELHKQGKTTFLVTNGLLPEVLDSITPPTQLYISIDAPNKKLWKRIDQSSVENGWEKLMQSLDVLKKLKNKTRTSVRITLIKDINMVNPEQYAELIKKCDATFVEVKAYMFVGSSRDRLKMENMPRHNEVKEFSELIAKECGYKILDEQKESRVVLLCKEEFKERIMKFDN